MAVRTGGLIWTAQCSIDMDKERSTYELQGRIHRLLHRRHIGNERVMRLVI